jgi:hypothetical protein
MKYSNDPALLLALTTACVPVELRLRRPDLVPGRAATCQPAKVIER